MVVDGGIEVKVCSDISKGGNVLNYHKVNADVEAAGYMDKMKYFVKIVLVLSTFKTVCSYNELCQSNFVDIWTVNFYFHITPDRNWKKRRRNDFVFVI